MARVDLDVPFSEKDEAKALGARWDPQAKVWFVPEGRDSAPLARWLPQQQIYPSMKAKVVVGFGTLAPMRNICCDAPDNLVIKNEEPISELPYRAI